LKLITNFLIILGGIAILIIIFMMAGYSLFLLTPEMKSNMHLSKISAAEVKSFNTKFDAFKKEIQDASLANQKKEATLVITEDELNTKIVELLAEGKLPFKELLINLNKDVAWIYCVFDNPGGNAKLGLILKSEVVNGDIKVNVLDFQLGRLPLPDSLGTYAGDLTNIFLKMQNPANNLPLEIKSLVISEKLITIKAVSKPLI
jgi:uncharacterized protein YpmS